MYQVGGWLELLNPGPRATTTRESLRQAIPRIVIFLGLTSLFTDISSEMVVSILPIYLVGFLRMSPAEFGFVDGLYQGVAGVVQLASAIVADRIRRYKEMAAIGYGSSVLCRVGLLLTTSWSGLTGFLVLDRFGKGIRSAPRDALISFSVPRGRLGTAFGVHRALDAVGAMLGPVLAFVILHEIANGFDVVFVVSLCVAVVGFAVLWLFVEYRPPEGPSDDLRAPGRATPEMAIRLLHEPAFRHLALATLMLGGLTISDGFVYLTLQRLTEMPAGAFPLLYVLTSAGYLVFAMPIGQLADRIGRFRVFLAGHVLLIVLYASLIGLPAGFPLIGLAVLLLSAYYASTEGVLMALGSAHLPEGVRTSGLAVLTTTLAVARFGGSVVFGFCWTRFGLTATITTYLVGLAAAIALVVISRPRRFETA